MDESQMATQVGPMLLTQAWLEVQAGLHMLGSSVVVHCLVVETQAWVVALAWFEGLEAPPALTASTRYKYAVAHDNPVSANDVAVTPFAT